MDIRLVLMLCFVHAAVIMGLPKSAEEKPSENGGLLKELRELLQLRRPPGLPGGGGYGKGKGKGKGSRPGGNTDSGSLDTGLPDENDMDSWSEFEMENEMENVMGDGEQQPGDLKQILFRWWMIDIVSDMMKLCRLQKPLFELYADGQLPPDLNVLESFFVQCPEHP